MSLTLKNASRADPLIPGDRFRATFAVTKLGGELPVFLGGSNLAQDMRYLFEDGLARTHLAIAISQPAVAAGDKASTIAIQIVEGGRGKNVGNLSDMLQQAVPGDGFGPDVELVTLERYAAGQGSAADRAALDTATDSGNALTETTGFSGLAQDLGHGVKTVLYVGLAIVAIAVLMRFGTGRAGQEWL